MTSKVVAWNMEARVSKSDSIICINLIHMPTLQNHSLYTLLPTPVVRLHLWISQLSITPRPEIPIALLVMS